MKVLLRNPRRELEVPAPRTVEQLLRDLDVVPESVLVIRNDTLVTRDERLVDDDVVEIRPVISGGAMSVGRVKCRRCREPAVIDVRRHNAAFCADCFVRHCREQVRRAIDDLDMIEPGERVLVAVSGGKDSLGLWQLLRELGYEADGLYVGLGIGEYSDTSGDVRARLRGAATSWRLPRGRPARRLRLRRSRRLACSQARAVLCVRALEASRLQRGRVEAAATTCSRPDTTSTTKRRCCSATCCGGTRSTSVASILCLPAAPGFVRKVKPLVRLGERELAAYCVLTGIDYIVEECPMAAGNRHLGYKEVLNAIEERSPGTKASFLFGFLDRAPRPLRRRTRWRSRRRSSARAAECGAPTPGDVCAFCRLPGARAIVANPGRRSSRRDGRVRAGDRVLLVDNKRRRHLDHARRRRAVPHARRASSTTTT